jgi:hypothetical protein
VGLERERGPIASNPAASRNDDVHPVVVCCDRPDSVETACVDATADEIHPGQEAYPSSRSSSIADHLAGEPTGEHLISVNDAILGGEQRRKEGMSDGELCVVEDT